MKSQKKEADVGKVKTRDHVVDLMDPAGFSGQGPHIEQEWQNVREAMYPACQMQKIDFHAVLEEHELSCKIFLQETYIWFERTHDTVYIFFDMKIRRCTSGHITPGRYVKAVQELDEETGSWTQIFAFLFNLGSGLDCSLKR